MATLLVKAVGSVVSAIARLFRSPRKNSNGTSKISYFRMSRTRPSSSLQTVDLKVRMCCTGCVRLVKNSIRKLRGVDSVEINLEMERVTVTGYVDRNKVLKAVRRTGKRAEFWPYQHPHQHFTSPEDYFTDTSKEYRESYNYYRHGYNMSDRHGNIPAGRRGDDKVSNLFNDDNVNACRLM